jgi:hypothetical protein
MRRHAYWSGSSARAGRCQGSRTKEPSPAAPTGRGLRMWLGVHLTSLSRVGSLGVGVPGTGDGRWVAASSPAQDTQKGLMLKRTVPTTRAIVPVRRSNRGWTRTPSASRHVVQVAGASTAPGEMSGGYSSGRGFTVVARSVRAGLAPGGLVDGVGARETLCPLGRLRTHNSAPGRRGCRGSGCEGWESSGQRRFVAISQRSGIPMLVPVHCPVVCSAACQWRSCTLGRQSDRIHRRASSAMARPRIAS